MYADEQHKEQHLRLTELMCVLTTNSGHSVVFTTRTRVCPPPTKYARFSMDLAITIDTETLICYNTSLRYIYYHLIKITCQEKKSLLTKIKERGF
jgi:hypothetical protein